MSELVPNSALSMGDIYTVMVTSIGCGVRLAEFES